MKKIIVSTSTTFILVFFIIKTMATADIVNIPKGQTCMITKVIDGDTMHAVCNDRKTKIRMTIIDSYEKSRNNRAYKQAYIQKMTIDEVVQRGKKASAITKHILEGQTIKFVPDTTQLKDRYNRDLGLIYFNNEEINSKLLTEHPDVFLKY